MSIALSLASNPSPARAQPAGETLEELVLALQQGHHQVFEALIARTQGACSRLALSILKDPELARDALQEAYILVYQRIHQLRHPAAAQSWLYRIVTHCCHDLLRSRGKLPTLQEEVEVADEAPDLAEQLTRQERIRRCFSRLPEIDRTALALREICAMSYEEMAQLLKIPLGTVRSRLAKARQRFIHAYKGGSREH